MKFIYVDAAYYRAREVGIYANRVMHVMHRHRFNKEKRDSVM